MKDHAYQIGVLPPGMLVCCNIAAAASLLNRSRSTISSRIKSGLFRGYRVSGNVVVPLVDIAQELDVSETQAYNTALASRLPLLRIYAEEVQ